jgi:hypothetical protein
MSGLKNIVLVVLAGALIGETWYFVQRISDDGRRIDAWKKEEAGSQEQVRRMKIQLKQLQMQAASRHPAPSTVDSAPADPMELRMAGILDRIHLLKTWDDRHPEQRIGEFAYLNDNDWIRTCAQSQNLESDEDYRKALAELRQDAERDFLGGPMHKALTAYFKASGDMLPSDVSQLAAYLDPSVDPSLLQHYEMIAAGSSKATRDMPVFALNPQTAIIDTAYDNSLIASGPGGTWEMGSGGNQSMEYLLDQMQARNAYRLANSGQQPQTPDQIAPYFKNSQFETQYLAGIQKAR